MLNPKKKYSNGIQTYNNCMDQLEKTGNCLLGGGQGGEKTKSNSLPDNIHTRVYLYYVTSNSLNIV